jgi:hypothetical protein
MFYLPRTKSLRGLNWTASLILSMPLALHAGSVGLTTTASPSITLGPLGAPTLSDSGVLTNGFNPSGSLVFTLTGPGGFSYQQTDTVSGDGTYTASTTLPTSGLVAGTYTWTAHYSGDSNNNPVDDQGGTAEQSIVSAANPFLYASPDPFTIFTLAVMTDTATLSGGYYPTGTITFTLYDPNSSVVDTEPVTVSGNGTYITPTGFNPSVLGSYHWSASYSGNANNNSAIGATPEPNALILLGTAVAALAFRRRLPRKS